MRELNQLQMEVIAGGRTECVAGWISMGSSIAGGLAGFVTLNPFDVALGVIGIYSSALGLAASKCI